MLRFYRSRKMLQILNEYSHASVGWGKNARARERAECLPVRFGFDTAENERSKVCLTTRRSYTISIILHSPGCSALLNGNLG